MSVLDEVLIEEYKRASRVVAVLEKELAELPRGSVRTKRIGHNNYYYLQYREGSKVRSRYIPKEKLEDVRQMVARRKENEAAIKEQRASLRKIEKALGGKPT